MVCPVTSVDIFDFSRTRSSLEGDLDASDLAEAFSLLEGPAADIRVHYSARGTTGRDGLPGAELTLSARAVTACVRCGEPVEIVIDKTVPFLFTRTEQEADKMPVDEDGEFEIVVGSTKFNVAAWVQEEVILSLPAFAQHDDCTPDVSRLQTQETAETLAKPNPFAVLAGLKVKK